MQNDLIFMQLAYEEAERAAAMGEVPVGAVLVHQDKVIARGCNAPISMQDPTYHAEIAVLRAGAQILQNYRLLNTTLYVTLEPCAMCVGAMVHARVQRVVFGAADPKTGALTSKICLLDLPCFNHRFDWKGGVMSEECGTILQRFFQARR